MIVQIEKVDLVVKQEEKDRLNISTLMIDLQYKHRKR